VWTIAIVHADTRGRDSMPLDLMEAVRPSVDRYLLALLRDRVFRASDFYETQRGNCRLLAPLTHELTETLPAWRKLIAPVAEQGAELLLQGEPTIGKLPTPLTETNRRTDRARRLNHTNPPTQTRTKRPERRCKRCGGELPRCRPLCVRRGSPTGTCPRSVAVRGFPTCGTGRPSDNRYVRTPEWVTFDGAGPGDEGRSQPARLKARAGPTEIRRPGVEATIWRLRGPRNVLS
jgi:hypothetical protein